METNKIYLGDAYELIKEVEDKSVDLIITDPPYEMESGGNGKKEMALRFRKRYAELRQKKLDVGMDLGFLKELERVCKHIYIYIYMVQQKLTFQTHYSLRRTRRCQFRFNYLG